MLSALPTKKVDKNGPPIITYSSESLAAKGKKGVLPVLDNGYRSVILSILNTYNVNGAWYPGEANQRMFDTELSPNTLMARRLAKRRLAAELGHPVCHPTMTPEQHKLRCMTIQEDNIVAHIRKIIINSRDYKDEADRPVIAIMGEVCPAGPHAALLEREFANPDIDVAWSVRSLSKSKFHTGREERFFTEVMGWDKVNDPGLDNASKFAVLNMESAAEHGNFNSSFTVTVAELEALAEIRQAEGLTTESAYGQDVRIVLENMKANRSDVIVNATSWLGW